ncbi:MAG: hypothetical protein QXD48_02480 [Candidatus Aenigmatarchaeota archaeon]
MPKLSRSKGQWFIISAIMVSAAFLIISIFFKGYYGIDTSRPTKLSEDYYFMNIKEQFNKVVQDSNCTNMDKNLKEFKYFSEKVMGELGYFLYINYSIISCPPKNIRMGMLLASDKMILHENINPNDVIPGIE